MSVSATPETTSSDERVEASRKTRLDAPHAIVQDGSAPAEGERPDEPLGQALLEVADEPAPLLLAAVTGETLESRREQLQLQVSQLAGHLRERLREVDRREAALNARASQLEADLRASRLWLRERENDFQQREQELKRQIEELQEQSARRVGDRAEAIALLSAAGASGDADDHSRLQDLTEREHQLQLKEIEFRERRFELDRQSAALRHAQQVWEHQRSRAEQEQAQERLRLEAEFQERAGQRDLELRACEALLAEQSQQIDRDRAALAADRREWEDRKTRELAEAKTQESAAAQGLNDERQRLEARQEWIERQKAGLEQVRSEILALHRQSLEMRLIAEQLWSQITGRLTPAEVARVVAQLRLKLTEQYQLEEQQLDDKREELVSLGERLTAQHAELKQLQAGLREWTAARQAEIEQQAAALVQRELALDSEEEQHRQALHAWQAERRRLEQQIRDLSAQARGAAA